jgi:integrase
MKIRPFKRNRQYRPSLSVFHGLPQYVLAAWTGYRKGEIGSLTKQSFQLDADPPTATIQAACSKRKRQDKQVLHEALVTRLRAWLETKKPSRDELLFPVSGKVPGGIERKTAKMMKRDLAAARSNWLEEFETDAERSRHEESDFLRYCDHDGRFADFHSNRHTFIISLSRNAVSPRMAQSLARHSDIRLTMGTYTHVEVNDQQAAIESLPAPPAYSSGTRQRSTRAGRKASDDDSEPSEMVPKMVPFTSPRRSINLHQIASKTPPSGSRNDKSPPT